MNTTKKSPKEIAEEVKSLAKSLGWTIEKKGGTVVTISKKIQGRDEFIKADMEYFSILSAIPQTTSGSMWGTDGGGVGSLSAMNHGLFTMNKSGCSKRVMNYL